MRPSLHCLPSLLARHGAERKMMSLRRGFTYQYLPVSFKPQSSRNSQDKVRDEQTLPYLSDQLSLFLLGSFSSHSSQFQGLRPLKLQDMTGFSSCTALAASWAGLQAPEDLKTALTVCWTQCSAKCCLRINLFSREARRE